MSEREEHEAQCELRPEWWRIGLFFNGWTAPNGDRVDTWWRRV